MRIKALMLTLILMLPGAFLRMKRLLSMAVTLVEMILTNSLWRMLKDHCGV